MTPSFDTLSNGVGFQPSDIHKELMLNSQGIGFMNDQLRNQDGHQKLIEGAVVTIIAVLNENIANIRDKHGCSVQIGVTTNIFQA